MRAPSATFDVATAPASPPPQRRQPTVATPTSAAVSRWSDAACRPERESSISASTVGGTVITSGSGGPPRPIATTTTSCSAESSLARCPVTAVFPTRFPVPTTAIEGSAKGSSRRRIEPEVRPDVRDAAGQHPAGERETLGRAEHGLVGEVDDDVRGVRGDRGLDVGGERDPVFLTSAQLLLPADENRGGEVVRKLHERVTHDGGVVLAVDDRNRPHVRAVTSSSMVPVNFAYSSVSSEKETSRSWPWNG